MHNIFLFARREYLETVRKKSFLVMTILLPALMFGFTVLPSMLMSRKNGEAQKLVVATPNAQFGDDIRARIVAPPEAGPSEQGQKARNIVVDVDTNVSLAEEKRLSQEVSSRQIDGYLWAPAEALAARKFDYRASSSSDFDLQSMLQSAAQFALLKEALRSHGASGDEVESALKTVDINAQKVQNGKVVAGGGAGLFFTTLLLMVLLYTTIIIYGMSVMRSVIEEKNSRIFEVLLSAATPRELMAGKILGTALVGLTQIAIWTLAAATIGAGTMISMGGQKFQLSLSVFNMIFFGAFFLLGFLLYSALSAALGSSVNSEQEAQQLQMIVLMPLILSVIFMTPVIQHPHSTLSVVLSLIPFCAPLLMYIRIVVETPPMWQIGLSIVLLIGTIYVMLSICSRIYRIGILMYGKRPTLPEIVKWMKYA